MHTRIWCSTNEVPWVIWSLWRNKLNFPVNRITGLQNWQRTILALQKTTPQNVENKYLKKCITMQKVKTMLKRLSVALFSRLRLDNVTLQSVSHRHHLWVHAYIHKGVRA